MSEAISRREFVRMTAAAAAAAAAAGVSASMAGCARPMTPTPVGGQGAASIKPGASSGGPPKASEFEGFETLSDWSCAAGSQSADTSHVLHGSAGLKLTSTDGEPAYSTKAVTLEGAHDPFRLWFYLAEDPSAVSSIRIAFSPVADFSAGFYASIPGGMFGWAEQGWNCFSLSDVGDWNHVGGSWNDAQRYLRVTVNASASRTANVTFDSLWRQVAGTAQIAITFDDGRGTEYKNAFPYMRSKGLVGTMYVVPKLVGHPTYVTKDELTEMQNAGWDVASHTFDHASLTRLTQAQQESELMRARTWLESNGFTRASRHVSYPLGLHNDDTMAAMAAMGMISGRTTSTATVLFPPVNPYTIAGDGIGGGASLAYAKLRIDDAKNRQGTAILLFHGIGDNPVDRHDWSTVDFRSAIDYIVEQKIPVLRITDLFAPHGSAGQPVAGSGAGT